MRFNLFGNKQSRVVLISATVCAYLLMSVVPVSGLASSSNASVGGANSAQAWSSARNLRYATALSSGHHHSHGSSGVDDTESASPISAAQYAQAAGVTQLMGWRSGLLTNPAWGGTLGSSDISPKDESRNMTLLGNLPRSGINSDLAFWGNIAVAGNYEGFRIVDISDPAHIRTLSTVACHGPQNDVSIWNNLLFLSVDRPQTAVTCSGDAPNANDPSTFEGIRIFNISDPTNPQFVTGVSTDCGSHTNTLIPDVANNRVLLYVSSYFVSNGPHCGPGREANPLHKKISIVSVPLNAPEQAAVVATPEIEADQFVLGSGPTVGCHDITVFLDLHLAAGACMSEGQIWDISDPLHPQTLNPKVRIRNAAFDFWHSATFTWDARYVVFGDETFSTGCTDPNDPDGRIWIYNNYAPFNLLGSFVQPRPSSASEYCSAHLFNFMPTTDGYLLATSWYEGGVNIVDINHPTAPQEEAFYHARTGQSADTWSAYWYNNHIYAGDISRGFDAFSYTTTAQHEFVQFPYMNPQTQEHVIYPAPARPNDPSSKK